MARSDDIRARVRILCNPGSQASFATERLATRLAAPSMRVETRISGIGTGETVSRGRVQLSISAINSADCELDIAALVLPRITGPIPAVQLDRKRWQFFDGLELADPQFNQPGEVDIFFDADLWGDVLLDGWHWEGLHGLGAQRSRFSWEGFGPATAATRAATQIYSGRAMLLGDEDRLDQLVRRFWLQGEAPTQGGASDEDCARIFERTHTRTSDGRYMVRLPFRASPSEVGDSFGGALRQFQNLELHLAFGLELRMKYVATMREYQTLGHMVRVDQLGDRQRPHYYIPHHAVLRKFRVGNNASARTANSVSLNDIQLVGPTIQPTLLHIFLRFRRFRVALTADVEKMYSQVLVEPEHREFQRFLWRESPSQPLEHYQLTTVVFSMAASPYLAVRAMQQCAHDNYDVVADPGRAAVALSAFYIDNFLLSAHAEETAIQVAQDVTHILSPGISSCANGVRTSHASFKGCPASR